MRVDITDDEAEHARLWDRDEQARDIAEEAMDSLVEHVDLRDPTWKRRRVLDVGCGTGLLTAHLAPHVREVVAVDVAPAMLEVLRTKELPNVEVRCADVDDARWIAGFDLVVASCVCATMPNYPATVRRLADALCPGGLFVQWDWLREEDDDGDGLTLDEVTTAFAGAGLSCVHVDHEFDALFDEDPLLMGVGLKMVILG